MGFGAQPRGCTTLSPLCLLFPVAELRGGRSEDGCAEPPCLKTSASPPGTGFSLPPSTTSLLQGL